MRCAKLATHRRRRRMGEAKAVLMEHTQLALCAVSGMPDEKWDRPCTPSCATPRPVARHRGAARTAIRA